jgi:hypothetical protein
MLRYVAAIVLVSASPCFAQPSDRMGHAPLAEQALNWSDPFVISGDACGASALAGLVGEAYSLHRAAIPESAIVHGPADTSALSEIGAAPARPSAPLTLEYRPARLNVGLDGSARILSVGCH